MFNDLYHAEYAHKEYERRIHAVLLERAVLKARQERAHALSRLAADLAMTTRRWGRRILGWMRWTLPAPGKPYGQTPNRGIRWCTKK
jgi:hypothetical protein